MPRTIRVCSALLLGAALHLAPVAAGAAVADPRPMPPPNAAPAAPPTETEAFAARLYTTGMDRITRYYVDGIEVRDLAIAGLNGLTALEPALRVEATAEGVQLYLDDKPVALALYPSGNDAADWAGLVALSEKALRERSDTLSAAERGAITEAIFKGFTSRLDRFSGYTTPAAAADQRANRNGFTGTGIRYRRADGHLHVTEVFSGGPADGILRKGDLITHADGVDLAPMDKPGLARALRGKSGTPVVLTVVRDGQTQTLTVVRGKVVPPTVKSELRDGILLVRIERFNGETAKQVFDTVRDAGPVQGAILDLRGNPGGLLDQAVAIADLFMQEGAIVSTRGHHPLSRQSYTAEKGDILKGAPLVVLVDGRAASSSEILAAALQDSGRAMVMGTNTYGKGSVQKVVALPDGGELKVTWSRFYSPRGYAIQGLGILPSICLKGGEVTEDEAATGPVLAAVGAEEGQTVAALPMDAALAEQWRTVPLEDEAGRTSLRQACEQHNRTGLEVDVSTAFNLVRTSRNMPLLGLR